MARIVDLNAVLSDELCIKIGESEYCVADLSTETYLRFVRAQRDAGDSDGEKAVENMIELIGSAIPDMPKDDLAKLGLRQLRALMQALTNFFIESMDEGEGGANPTTPRAGRKR